MVYTYDKYILLTRSCTAALIIVSHTEHGDEKLLTHFTMDIKVTQDMAPNAKVLVYYIRDDFEVVATSVEFDIKSCFKNKVC